MVICYLVFDNLIEINFSDKNIGCLGIRFDFGGDGRLLF